MIAQMTMGQQMMALMREEIAAAPSSSDEESSEVIRILRERNAQLEEQLGHSRAEMAALLESKELEMMQMLEQLEGLDGADTGVTSPAQLEGLATGLAHLEALEAVQQ